MGSNKRAWNKGKEEIGKPRKKENILIFEWDLTPLWSYVIEAKLIRWFGRLDKKSGILRNKTDGGDGAIGWVATEETKQRMSESAIKNVENGSHHLLSGELQKKAMLRRVEEGTHNWLGGEAGKKASDIQFATNRHPSQIKKTCPYCGVTCSTNMYAKHHGDNCPHKPGSNNIRENKHLRKAVHTPLGVFVSMYEAAKSFDVTVPGIRYRCKSKSSKFGDWYFL